jgi:hypothetical protein
MEGPGTGDWQRQLIFRSRQLFLPARVFGPERLITLFCHPVIDAYVRFIRRICGFCDGTLVLQREVPGDRHVEQYRPGTSRTLGTGRDHQPAGRETQPNRPACTRRGRRRRRAGWGISPNRQAVGGPFRARWRGGVAARRTRAWTTLFRRLHVATRSASAGQSADGGWTPVVAAARCSIPPSKPISGVARRAQG